MGFLLWNPGVMQRVELIGYDYLIMNTEPVQNENILIVDLDEDLLKNYGGWPLPRSLYGDLITTTNAIPGFTVLMPNPDLRGKDYDDYFAMRMQYTPTVLASAASTQVTGINPHVGTAQLGEDPTPWLFKYPGILPTTSVLEEKAQGSRSSNRYSRNRRSYSSYSSSRKRRVKTLPKFRTRTLKSRNRRPKLPNKNRRTGFSG